MQHFKTRPQSFRWLLSLELQIARLRLDGFVCVAASGRGVLENNAILYVKNIVSSVRLNRE